MSPCRYLLSRTDRLGDLILSTPVASALKRNFPEAEVFFLARPYAAEILRIHPHVDGVVIFDPGESLESVSRRLRAFRFAAALALFPRPNLAWAFYRAGIPQRLGTGYRWYSALFTQRIFEHRKGARRHEAEYNLQLLRPLGLAAAEVEFHYRFSPQEESHMRAKLAELGIAEKVAVLHPGSGGSARDWPPESFAALADALGREQAMQVVLTGGADEKKLTQFIQQQTQTKPWSATIPHCGAPCRGLSRMPGPQAWWWGAP